MKTDLALAEDAARLLCFGLRPRLRPAEDPAYAELLRRYRNEGPLREHVAAIARGLGLSVLGETAHGVVLGAEGDGPFALKLTDYRRTSMRVEERMTHGLIQLAVAAWCFPTAESLEDPDSVAGARVTTNKLVEYLVSLCEELEQRSNDDVAAGEEDLAEAWRAVLARAETRGTADGRRASHTLSGMVSHALGFLEQGGLMRKLSDDEGGTWQALGAYRVQVRELAAHDAARMVRAAGAAAREG